jgi:hypothetical protein
MMHQESENNDETSSWDSESGHPLAILQAPTPRDDNSVLSTQTSSTNNNFGDGPLVITRPSSDKKRRKKNQSGTSPFSIQYKNINIYQAAEQGSLPLCVLLWGMASAKRVNLLVPDVHGNNPLHAAALADSAEVHSFLSMQYSVI